MPLCGHIYFKFLQAAKIQFTVDKPDIDWTNYNAMYISCLEHDRTVPSCKTPDATLVGDKPDICGDARHI